MRLANFYMYARGGWGIRKSFLLAFGLPLHHFLLNVAWYAMLVLVLCAGLNKGLNMVAEAHRADAEMVKELGNIVTKCTSPGDNAIYIDGELWMCGAARTGVKL